MSQHIDAIYENGVLKPIQPLSLPEQAQVKIIVQAVEDAEYQRQLIDLQGRLREGLEQCERGEVGPFDAEETKARLRKRLAKEGIE